MKITVNRKVKRDRGFNVGDKFTNKGGDGLWILTEVDPEAQTATYTCALSEYGGGGTSYNTTFAALRANKFTWVEVTNITMVEV